MTWNVVLKGNVYGFASLLAALAYAKATGGTLARRVKAPRFVDQAARRPEAA
jgi:hypothetical protein